MRMYSYYMTQRPAMPGAMPREGLYSVEDLDPREIIPEINNSAYSLIVYTRKLTDQEMYDYELTPCTADTFL